VNNTLVPEIEKENFTFCLMYETSIVLDNCIQHGKNFTDIFLNDLTYARHYFDSPKYLHIDGKPVFFIYNLRYLYDTIDNTTAVHGLFDNLRQQFQKSGGIYLIEDLGSGRNTPQDVNEYYLYSLNATTFYLYSSVAGGWNAILGNATTYYPNWLSYMKNQSIGFIPNVYPGYDNTDNTDGSPPAVLTPDQTMFARFLEIAKNNTDSALGMIMITSWNEWMEATEIEPSMESGELFLHTAYNVVPMFKEFAPRLAGAVSLFNVRYPNRQYDPNYDITNDGKINMRDISIIIRYIGETT
jgi:hypothetical protein